MYARNYYTAGSRKFQFTEADKPVLRTTCELYESGIDFNLLAENMFKVIGIDNLFIKRGDDLRVYTKETVSIDEVRFVLRGIKYQ